MYRILGKADKNHSRLKMRFTSMDSLTTSSRKHCTWSANLIVLCISSCSIGSTDVNMPFTTAKIDHLIVTIWHCQNWYWSPFNFHRDSNWYVYKLSHSCMSRFVHLCTCVKECCWDDAIPRKAVHCEREDAMLDQETDSAAWTHQNCGNLLLIQICNDKALLMQSLMFVVHHLPVIWVPVAVPFKDGMCMCDSPASGTCHFCGVYGTSTKCRQRQRTL